MMFQYHGDDVFEQMMRAVLGGIAREVARAEHPARRRNGQNPMRRGPKSHHIPES
jgi:hypothetical protein